LFPYLLVKYLKSEKIAKEKLETFFWDFSVKITSTAGRWLKVDSTDWLGRIKRGLSLTNKDLLTALLDFRVNLYA